MSLEVWRHMTFAKAVNINPKRSLKAGAVVPYVEMAAVPTAGANIKYLLEREGGGGGAKFQNGDTLFARITPCAENGKTAFVDCLRAGETGLGSTELIVFGPKPELTDPAYVYHLARSELVRGPAISQMVGTTGRARVPNTVFDEITIRLPPLHEQRRIAEILSSVDQAIAATRSVIEQTRKVKQSSLGALFHRGNWTDAELPHGHRLTRLEDIARRRSGHTPSKTFSEYWNGGVAWVSLQDTKALDRRHINNTAANISDLGVKNSSAEVHPAGTVFVSRDATVGRVGIMPTPMAVSQHFIAWTCGPMLDNLFLYYWLLNMKPVFERIAAGSTIKTIGLGFFKELQITLPDMAIQKLVASQMMAIDDALDGNEASLDELKALKSALMSDLLTGRKRVTDALPMAAE